MNLGKWKYAVLTGLAIFSLAGCGGQGQEAAGDQGHVPEGQSGAAPAQIKIALDWSPNTNHTGLYVAKDQGYYQQEGLNAEIVQPGAGGAEAMVASGDVDFAVSYQEVVSQARTQGVPIVSIAAVIQHNTSGFASPAFKNIKTPKDFEGKTYGGYGSPTELALLQSVMQFDHADAGKVKIVNTGEGDFFTSMKRDIDFALIYYGWTGIEAELRKEPLNIVYLNHYSDSLDFYTPVLITSEKMIKEKPEIVKAFMAATSKGYQYAIEKPEEAAQILLKAAPDLDRDLVFASQKWLSPRYQDDAPRWGEQKKSVWENYAKWMYEHHLLEKPLDTDAAFTNEFLPDGK